MREKLREEKQGEEKVRRGRKPVGPALKDIKVGQIHLKKHH